MEEAASRGNHIEITIKKGYFLRDPELMIEAARERPDVRSFKTLVSCSLLDRNLADSTARFSAAAAGEGCHPHWDHVGKLFGYLGDDVLEIQLRSLQIDTSDNLTDEERIQSRYELMSSVKIDSTMFIPNGFSGEVQLKRDVDFFRGAHHSSQQSSLEIDIKLVDPLGTVSCATSRRSTRWSLMQSEVPWRSGGNSLPTESVPFRAGRISLTEEAEMAEKVTMKDKPSDESSKSEELSAFEGTQSAATHDFLTHVHDIPEDAGANSNMVEAMEAEHRAQEACSNLFGHIAVLKDKILEMEKEIRDFQEQDPLHGQDLRVLSSTSNLLGSPTPHLAVGAPIFGAAAAAKANAKTPHGQSVAVQTEESQDAGAETELLNTLRAEAAGVKFKLKELSIKNDAAQHELQVISEELGEKPTTTSV